MRNTRHLFGIIGMVILILLLVPYAIDMISVMFTSKRFSVWEQLSLYQWLPVGFAIYMVLRRLAPKNALWLETYTHESIHAAMALLHGRQIKQFVAGEQGGCVYSAGRNRLGETAITLSPYCLPMYVYPLLVIRMVVNTESLWLPDIVIGFALCLHVYCFVTQTNIGQPDIRSFPLVYSYLYIVCGLVMNFCIIWVAFFSQYNVFSSFWRMVCAVWGNLAGLFV